MRFLLILLLNLLVNLIFAQEIIPGRVIVKRRPSTNGNEFLVQINSDSFLKSLPNFKCIQKFPHHRSPEPSRLKEGCVDLTLFYEISFAQGDVFKVINYLQNQQIIEYAEPRFKRDFLFTPNDPQVVTQYHLDIIKAMHAYNIQQGDTNVVVGISDTGVDLMHPDLKDNIKRNYADPVDGVDNDFDGYIDNFIGWDLAENDNNPQYEAHVHGVHVSGISSATTNNNEGIAGVGFKCKFLPLKIMNAQGFIVSEYESIVYAADHGCAIVNCSWGGLGQSKYEQEIINYATFNQNCLVIAAAGNSDNQNPFYPASYKNVLSVAATNNLDAKWSGSSFNEFVGVSAPGQDILSTLGNGTYGFSSGTSMAAPVVAGVAALVKSQFPQFGAQQILEQIKATADFIDTVNSPLYSKKMGVGRVNAYRALTELKPGIRFISYSVTDSNDEVFVVGDTLKLSAFFTNVLQDAVGAAVVLSCSSPYVTILNPNFNVGAWPSNQIKSNTTNPFKILIKSNTPLNHRIILLFEYYASNYRSYEAVELVVNEDILNITINEIKTSVSSRGYIGFNNPFQTQGLGVVYKGNNLLYLGSLMLGNSTTQVSDNLYGSQPNSYDQDFFSLSRATRIFQNPRSDYDVAVSFNDQSAGASRLNVRVNQNNFAWSSSINSKYILYNYQIINNGVTPLGSLYASIFADWDIKNPLLNKCSFLQTQKLMYAHSSQPGSPLVAIKLLNHKNLATYYALDMINDSKVDLTDGLTEQEKFILLTSVKENAGPGPGSDIACVVGAGPFFLYPNDTVDVHFALLVADSLSELLQIANVVQTNYDQLFVGNKVTVNSIEMEVFPNPAKQNIEVKFLGKGFVKIYSADGKLILEKNHDNQTFVNVENLSAGIYFIRLSDVNGALLKSAKVLVNNK